MKKILKCSMDLWFIYFNTLPYKIKPFLTFFYIVQNTGRKESFNCTFVNGVNFCSKFSFQNAPNHENLSIFVEDMVDYMMASFFALVWLWYFLLHSVKRPQNIKANYSIFVILKERCWANILSPQTSKSVNCFITFFWVENLEEKKFRQNACFWPVAKSYFSIFDTWTRN